MLCAQELSRAALLGSWRNAAACSSRWSSSFSCSSMQGIFTSASAGVQPMEAATAEAVPAADISTPAAEPACGPTPPQLAVVEQSPHADQRTETNSQASTSGRLELQKGPKQSCDFTLLAACAWELRERWLPAKVDQVLYWERKMSLVCAGSGLADSLLCNISGDPGRPAHSLPAPTHACHHGCCSAGGEAAGRHETPIGNVVSVTRPEDSPAPRCDSHLGGLGSRNLHPGAAKVRVVVGCVAACMQGCSMIIRAACLAGALAGLADSNGLVAGWLWICWEPGPSARLTMGPRPDRGAASEAFSFGAQMAGGPEHVFSARSQAQMSLACHTDRSSCYTQLSCMGWCCWMWACPLPGSVWRCSNLGHACPRQPRTASSLKCRAGEALRFGI